MQVPGPFEYERATSVDHAVGLLDRLGDGALIVAGGHSLLPMMKLRIAKPEYVIDIDPLAGELGYITEHADEVRIGAMTRHAALHTADRSSAASAWHSDPPIVPRLRTTGSAMTSSASRNRGNRFASRSDFRRSTWRVIAPILIIPSSSRM